MVRVFLLVFGVLALTAQTLFAQCRQALVLGLDVSGSVDAREYRLQIDGLVQALGSGPVRGALMTFPDQPVSLLVYEWSGPEDQVVVLPWTDITSEPVLDTALAQLQSTTRRDASPGTALGVAMQVGADFLAQRPDCATHTLDISGDGKSNIGRSPDFARSALARRGITINGLVIGADAPALGDLRQAEINELSSYYRSNVILGKDAFVETAIGFDDFAAAMQRKLERELRVLVFSDLK